MSSETKTQNKIKKKIRDLFPPHDISFVSSNRNIYTVFSCVNCKLNMNLHNFLSSGRPQSFLQLWHASPNTSIQRVSQTLQTEKTVPWKVYALENHLKFTILLVLYSRNRDSHTCPFQKAFAEICQWPPNPLGLRNTNEDCCSSRNVHTSLFLWYCSAPRSDSVNKTFLKRTNTDKLLNTVKGLIFSAVNVSSSG